MNIRLLKADEIDVRVGSINEKGATLLLYKDARVDMNILDESGVKWQRSHELINGNLFCTISIWDDEIKDWISRQDVGTESNTEKEKGQASDAFKRAGFNWGIGRELYTAPFIWVSAESYTGFVRNGKYGTYDKFVVTEIGYDDNREIKSLVIKNLKTGKIIYTLGAKPKHQTTSDKDGATQEIEANENALLTKAKSDIFKELDRQGYETAVSKIAFINSVLKKDVIATLNDADLVGDALDNNRGVGDEYEPGINQDESYNK